MQCKRTICCIMRRKLVKRRSKTVSILRKEVTNTLERIVVAIQKTPRENSKTYLCLDRWDILPKTDYTYARSESYSPRFCGRLYINPNMSRYHIHGKDWTIANPAVLDDVDYNVMYSVYSDVEGDDGRDLRDKDFDTSYERIKDGIELRSGKSLQTLKQMLHEHDVKYQQSDIINSVSRASYTMSKIDSLARPQKELYDKNVNLQPKSTNRKIQQPKKTKSVEKHHNLSHVALSKSSSYLENSNAHTRRSLDIDFDVNSYTHQNVFSNRSVQSKSPFYENESHSAKFSAETSRKTFTQEYAGGDNEFEEKGAIEMSEKISRSQKNQVKENNIRLYGLDYDGEFSDTDVSSVRSRSSYVSGSRSSAYSDDRRSVVSSTITGIVYTVTKPICSYVSTPAWKYVGQPVISVVSTILTSLGTLLWLLLCQPFIYLITVVCDMFSWLSAHGADGLVNGVLSVLEWCWRQVEYVSLQFVLFDVLAFKRRRKKGCFICLPLLLLLPLLLILLTGVDLIRNSSILDTVVLEKVYQQDKIYENTEQMNGLSNEIRAMVEQIKSSKSDQLTAADIEAIVYKILGQETAALKAELEETRKEEYIQWKNEQDKERDDVQKRHNDILKDIQDLKTTISDQKYLIDEHRADIKAQSAHYDEMFEGKLAALQAELQRLEQEQATLHTQVYGSCHNNTDYTTAVKANINEILAEIMRGHMSGNPAQDAFTQWLHSNYVNREVFNKRLQDLSTELTDSVIGMIRDVKEQQQHKEYLATQSETIVSENGSTVSELQVQQMIDEALFKYSADKTGIVDYALESAGGSIVSTRCSDTYFKKTALVSVFGIPLWYTTNSPRTIIQPEVYPGQCWAFKGGEGHVVIRTSTIIIPTGFTLEHIPKSLAPNGTISSAPKEFTVLGLDSEYERIGVSLGNYTYKDDGKPLQTFPVQNLESHKPYKFYELRILNNYGNLEHTCIYRFRIHGKPARRDL